MVISFSVFQARTQLLEKGMVYTFRWARRSFFAKEKGEVEITWANAKRGGKRIANVEIEEIGSIVPDDRDLEPYSKESGFASATKWYNKIWDMSNPYVIGTSGWLYRVSLLSDQTNSHRKT